MGLTEYFTKHKMSAYFYGVKQSDLSFPIHRLPVVKLGSWRKKVIVDKSLDLFLGGSDAVEGLKHLCSSFSRNLYQCGGTLTEVNLSKLSKTCCSLNLMGMSTKVLLSLKTLAIWTVWRRVPGPPTQ